VLISARVFMTVNEYLLIDDKKSHLKHVLHARNVQTKVMQQHT